MDGLLSGEVKQSKNVMDEEKRKLTPENSCDGPIGDRRSLKTRRSSQLITLKAQQTELELQNIQYELRQEKIKQKEL